MAERCVTWRRACFSSGTAEQAHIFRRPRLLSAAQRNVRVCNVCMLLRAHYAPNLQLAAETQPCLLARARAAVGRWQCLTGGQWARARVGRVGGVLGMVVIRDDDF